MLAIAEKNVRTELAEFFEGTHGLKNVWIFFSKFFNFLKFYGQLQLQLLNFVQCKNKMLKFLIRLDQNWSEFLRKNDQFDHKKTSMMIALNYCLEETSIYIPWKMQSGIYMHFDASVRLEARGGRGVFQKRVSPSF